jgi:hypothetical protein
LHVDGLSFRCTFTSEPDTWPERVTIVFPIAAESGSVARLALNIQYMASVASLSSGLEYEDVFVGKHYM